MDIEALAAYRCCRPGWQSELAQRHREAGEIPIESFIGAARPSSTIATASGRSAAWNAMCCPVHWRFTPGAPRHRPGDPARRCGDRSIFRGKVEPSPCGLRHAATSRHGDRIKLSQPRHGETRRGIVDLERARHREAQIDVRGAAGTAEAVALHHVHPGRAQEQLLLGGRTPSAVTFTPRPRPRPTTACTMAGGIGGALDRMHETAVDLELVEGEAAQIQRRLPNSRCRNHRAPAARPAPWRRNIASSAVSTLPSRRALRDLKLQPGLRRNRSWLARMRRRTTSTKSARRTLQRRKLLTAVHGCSSRGFGVEAGLAQHPFAERDDEARVLGDRDELGRRDFAALRMRPATQRLDPDHRFAAVVDDRLVGDANSPPLDGGAQVVLDQLALEDMVSSIAVS